MLWLGSASYEFTEQRASLKSLRYGVYSLMQKPRLTISRVAVIIDLATWRQIPAPHGRRNQNTIYDLPLLVFVLTTLPASPFFAVKPQTVRFIVQQATVSEGANLPSVLVPAPFSNLQPTRLRRQGYLEAEFDKVDLLPQDLVDADVLRECSQLRGVELRALDRIDGGESIQGML